MTLKKLRSHIAIFCRETVNRGGTYIYSLVGVILAPLIPLFIEAVVSPPVKKESYLITAAILAVGFLVIAEHNLMRAFHSLLFVITLILYTVTVSSHPVGMDKYAGYMLWSVVIAHSFERLVWHVFLDRPFPDFLKADRGS